PCVLTPIYFSPSLSHHSSSFFFHCYLPHRDLHSFPTRRSSDLSGRTLVLISVIIITLGLHTSGYFKLASNAYRGINNEGYSVLKDRKSTRLNSSHVSISYAVFCLKKKSHNSLLSLTLYLVTFTF